MIYPVDIIIDRGILQNAEHQMTLTLVIWVKIGSI